MLHPQVETAFGGRSADPPPAFDLSFLSQLHQQFTTHPILGVPTARSQYGVTELALHPSSVELGGRTSQLAFVLFALAPIKNS